MPAIIESTNETPAIAGADHNVPHASNAESKGAPCQSFKTVLSIRLILHVPEG